MKIFSSKFSDKRGARWSNSPLGAARGRAGFSLIEVMGILVIMSILASVLVPVMIRQIDRIFRQTETEQLQKITEALRTGAMRNKYIPSEADWVQVVAAEWGVETNRVSHNRRQTPRVFLIDPELRMGSNAGTLPYQQTSSGSVLTNGLGEVIPPLSPRILILSSLYHQDLPVAGGVAASAAEFNNIWNAPEGAVPAGWPASWAGKGNDLKVQRLNFAPLFQHLTLNNHDGPAGYFSIEGASPVQVPDQGFSAHFIENTALWLHNDEQALEVIMALVRGSSFVYDRGIWRGSISDADRIPFITELSSSLFIESNWNKNAGGSPPTTQQIVFDSMLNYMGAYANWANAGFPSHSQDSFRIAMYNAQSALSDLVTYLINNPEPEEGCVPSSEQ